MTAKGTLLIVAAPSGAGKSTLVKALLECEPDIGLSVSHTTRAPRAKERDGVHYHFVTRAVFDQMIAADEFFEYAVVHGDMKGTSLSAVAPLIDKGQNVLLEIDWQGAQQVRQKVPDCQSIFILPPSRAELERRLRNRASDSEEAIKRRLVDSRVDIGHADEFDYIVVNDDLDDALRDMRAIVRSLRLRTPMQRTRHAALIAELLGESDGTGGAKDGTRDPGPGTRRAKAGDRSSTT